MRVLKSYVFILFCCDSHFIDRFLSKETDAWFRTLVRENRAARVGLPFKREDFMQMLIDSQDKFGEIASECHCKSNFL